MKRLEDLDELSETDSDGRYRVELEMHSRLIRQLGFSRFRSWREALLVIVQQHFTFACPDWEQIERYCQRRGIPTGIVENAKKRRTLHGRLKVLRSDARLANVVHRFLRPLKKNRYLREAMKDFIARYGDLADLWSGVITRSEGGQSR